MRDALDRVLSRGLARTPRAVAVVCAACGETATFRELDAGVTAAARVLKARGVAAGTVVGLTRADGRRLLEDILACWRLGAAAAPVDAGFAKDEREAFLARADARFVARSALVYHTSGTTAGPKPVTIDRAAVAARLRLLSANLPARPGERWLCPQPLAQTLLYPAIHALSCGASAVLGAPADAPLVSRFWELCARYEVSVAHLTPSLVRLLLDSSEPRPARAPLRLATCAGAPLAPALALRFQRVFRTPLLDCYGLKETGLLASRRAGEPSFRPWRGSGLRVVDGRAAAAGPALARGYGTEIATWAAARRGALFLTGDRARAAAAGCVRLLGRWDDLILRGARKVAPEEVEAVLRRLPGVAQAAVFGVRDALSGARVAAVVVPAHGRRLDVAALRRACLERLAAYKCPDRIVLTRDLPRAAGGKLRRRELARLLEPRR